MDLEGLMTESQTGLETGYNTIIEPFRTRGPEQTLLTALRIISCGIFYIQHLFSKTNYSSRKSFRSYVCIVLNGKILSDCNLSHVGIPFLLLSKLFV